MAELPTARLHPRDAKDRLAILGVHARRAAGRVPGIARWVQTFVLTLVAVVYVVSRVIAWTTPKRDPDLPPPWHGPSASGLSDLSDLVVVDVPSPTGSGTIKSLARRPSAGSSYERIALRR